jgi:beta-aspartyl-peptidase (threonine type)
MPYFRKLLITSLLLSTTPLCASRAALADPSDPAPDRAAITKALADQQTAWNQADIDTFLTTYWRSPDVTFSGSSGTIRGWDAVLARYKNSYADRETMGQLQFSGLEFHFLGQDGALVLGHWHLTRTKGDIGGVFSLVWQRFPEGWRIIHDHTSAVPDTK